MFIVCSFRDTEALIYVMTKLIVFTSTQCVPDRDFRCMLPRRSHVARNVVAQLGGARGFCWVPVKCHGLVVWWRDMVRMSWSWHQTESKMECQMI